MSERQASRKTRLTRKTLIPALILGIGYVRRHMTIRWLSCPICHGITVLWNTVNDYQLERCRRCRFVFVNPRPSRGEMADFYRRAGGHCGAEATSLAEVLARERFYPNAVVDAGRMITNIAGLIEAEGARLLDVGCGYGLYMRAAQQIGFAVEGLEIAPFERSCTAELTGVQPDDVEFEEFPERPEEYAVVLMSQILEHAVDINEWVAKAGRLLPPGGVLCVAVPNFTSFLRRVLGTRDPFVNPPVHLNYFNLVNARLLFEKHGFRVRKSETISRLPPDVLRKRIGNAPRVTKDLAEAVVRYGQRPPLALFDAMRLGMFLNVYGVRA